MVFFVLTALVMPFVGRKIGWWLSKRFLYLAPLSLTVIACLLWGVAIACFLRYFINWLHPGIILKVIGFGGSGYIAVPNYGLFAESTIPGGERVRHELIFWIPTISFFATSAVLAFL